MFESGAERMLPCSASLFILAADSPVPAQPFSTLLAQYLRV
jgi:hypothetical protein